uniref:Uncharacterized protein n=1 Tax=Timema cristinae TaxID=61476 RepID=A0A7R9CZE6_TIMCR|nr:unnamed protein product [Timema cristinae]
MQLQHSPLNVNKTTIFQGYSYENDLFEIVRSTTQPVHSPVQMLPEHEIDSFSLYNGNNILGPHWNRQFHNMTNGDNNGDTTDLSALEGVKIPDLLLSQASLSKDYHHGNGDYSYMGVGALDQSNFDLLGLSSLDNRDTRETFQGLPHAHISSLMMENFGGHHQANHLQDFNNHPMNDLEALKSELSCQDLGSHLTNGFSSPDSGIFSDQKVNLYLSANKVAPDNGSNTVMYGQGLPNNQQLYNYVQMLTKNCPEMGLMPNSNGSYDGLNMGRYSPSPLRDKPGSLPLPPTNDVSKTCQFPRNLLQLASCGSPREVSPTSDNSLNGLDQQLNFNLLKLNIQQQVKNKEPPTPQPPPRHSPVYSPIGFPKNLNSRNSVSQHQSFPTNNNKVDLVNFGYNGGNGLRVPSNTPSERSGSNFPPPMNNNNEVCVPPPVFNSPRPSEPGPSIHPLQFRAPPPPLHMLPPPPPPEGAPCPPELYAELLKSVPFLPGPGSGPPDMFPFYDMPAMFGFPPHMYGFRSIR